VRHERLKLDMNPYTDEVYFLKKIEKKKTAKNKHIKKLLLSNLTLMTSPK
jgi:DUF2075 family protein